MNEIKIKDLILDNKVLVGPMAGVSDISFRSCVAPLKPGLIYSEMISSKGIVYDNQRTKDMCIIEDHEGPVALQLFGNTIEDMVEAAIYIDQNTKASVIDINMGCPVHKVVKGNGGASLMKDIQLAQDIVYNIVQNVSLPISVKIRTGWDQESINCVELAQAVESAGASLIAIHGRTRSQMYTGSVNLDLIKAVKEAVTIPVFGNGDIKTAEDAINMLEITGVDGVMVARQVMRDPWIVEKIKAAINHETYVDVTTEIKLEWLRNHFLTMCHYLGEDVAVKKMRGLAAQFASGLDGGKKLKAPLVRMQSLEEFDRIVTEYKLEKSEKL
ncbi:hypothetical protein AOC36_10990 [Erysipelothrix larvae]|uniref:tRNA-dihydrouridine synthase n=1 Tax=Erysipelothrix larvae TaxID=1514105 RepID=A0A0X8H1R1_9FIRM|nr:tRNA dihydrouridine synthase DusB [Erysipelothrix larvae]AMC94480.1 hypothetical protein AOC36_10990 [Erysipelothrix larvae]